MSLVEAGALEMSGVFEVLSFAATADSFPAECCTSVSLSISISTTLEDKHLRDVCSMVIITFSNKNVFLFCDIALHYKLFPFLYHIQTCLNFKYY